MMADPAWIAVAAVAGVNIAAAVWAVAAIRTEVQVVREIAQNARQAAGRAHSRIDNIMGGHHGKT